MNYAGLAIGAVSATDVYYIYGFLVEGLLIRKNSAPYKALYRSADTVMGYMPNSLVCMLISTFIIAGFFENSYEGAPPGGSLAGFGVLVGTFVACTFVGPNQVTFNIGQKLAPELAASTILQWTIG
jgi:hypothetical protein